MKKIDVVLRLKEKAVDNCFYEIAAILRDIEKNRSSPYGSSAVTPKLFDLESEITNDFLEYVIMMINQCKNPNYSILVRDLKIDYLTNGKLSLY